MAQTKAQLLGPVVGDVVMDVSTLSLDAEGNKVGIGHAEPDLTLHVSGVNGLPSSSGSTPTGHLTIRNKAGSSHGMFIGVSDAQPWSSWIQAQDASNNATNYPLLLNPNGGNIGIGTDSPLSALHVKGPTGGISARFTDAVNATVFVSHPSSGKSKIADAGGNYGFEFDTASVNILSSGTKSLSVNSDGSTTMHVNSATHQTFRFTTQGSNQAKLIMRDDNSNEDIVLNTGSSTYFNNDYNFGLGISTPSAKLHIQKNSSDTDFTNETTPSSTSGVQIANLATGAGTFTSLTLSVSSAIATQNASVIAKATSSGTAPELHFTQRSNSNTLSRLTITSGGQVLINDTTVSTNRSDAPLQIETGSSGNALNLRARSSDNIYSYLNFQNNAGSQTAAHIFLQRDASTNAGTLIFGTAAANASNSTDKLYLTSTGNVGIGTDDPGSHKLSVRNGDLHVTGNSNTDYDYIGGIQVGNGVLAPTLATFDNNQTTNYKRLTLASLHAGDVHLRSFWGVSVDINDGQLGDSGSATQARIPSTSSFTVNRRSGNGAFSTLFAVRNSGNVGISTDNPTAKLQVQGTSYITSKLSVGISQFTDNAGLTVSASGAKFYNDSLWMQPAGNVLFSARGGSGDDNWIGIGGYYNVTGGSSNILLQANFSNTSTGAGHAIRSIATGTGAQDFKIQRVYAAASTSGRPTYTDILTINNDGVLAFYTGANGSSNERFRINNHGNSIFQSQAPSATNGITGNAGLLIRGKTVDGSSTTVDLNISQSASTNGVHLEIQENSNNANALASLVFNHGSLKAMIATSRVATNNWGTDLRFYTHDDSTASANQHKVYERLRITSSGNVGIGTTNPGAKLEVNGGNARFGRSGLSILVRNSIAGTSGATLPATFVACTTDGGSNTAIVYWNQNYGSNQNQGCLGAVTATDTIVSPNTSVTYGCTIYGVVGRY